jgi:hypothetical protein
MAAEDRVEVDDEHAEDRVGPGEVEADDSVLHKPMGDLSREILGQDRACI